MRRPDHFLGGHGGVPAVVDGAVQSQDAGRDYADAAGVAPAVASFAAYRDVAGVINAGRSFLNSAVIATTTTVGIVITSLMAGYAFAKYHFVGRNVLFALMIATMFLPPIVTLIPLYRIVTYLGLNASLIGVIVPNLANAFGIFLMRQFIAGVPDELIDAARVDGASELRIVFSIVAPTVVPAIAALTLFAFVYHWNTYLWPLTVLQGNSEDYPIVISLSRLLELQSRCFEHQSGNGGRNAGGAAASGHVRLPSAVLCRQHRRVGGEGMSRALAIDLGGTNLRAGLCDPARPELVEPIGRWPAPTSRQAFEDLLRQLLAAHSVSRTGIAVPGLAFGTTCCLDSEPFLSRRRRSGESCFLASRSRSVTTRNSRCWPKQVPVRRRD